MKGVVLEDSGHLLNFYHPVSANPPWRCLKRTYFPISFLSSFVILTNGWCVGRVSNSDGNGRGFCVFQPAPRFPQRNESEWLWITVPLALLHPTTVCFPMNNTCLFYISTAAFLIYWKAGDSRRIFTFFSAVSGVCATANWSPAAPFLLTVDWREPVWLAGWSKIIPGNGLQACNEQFGDTVWKQCLSQQGCDGIWGQSHVPLLCHVEPWHLSRVNSHGNSVVPLHLCFWWCQGQLLLVDVMRRLTWSVRSLGFCVELLSQRAGLGHRWEGDRRCLHKAGNNFCWVNKHYQMGWKAELLFGRVLF